MATVEMVWHLTLKKAHPPAVKMRILTLLVYMLILCLLVSLVAFLLTAPTQQNEDWSEELPWEQHSEDLTSIKGSNRALQEALEGPELVGKAKVQPHPWNRFEYSIVQESRQLALHDSCKDFTNQTWAELSDHQRQVLAQRIVVSDDHRLLYCTVPLVGNGPWMKVFYYLGTHGEGLGDISKVPPKALGTRKNFVYLSSFSYEEQSRRIQSYLKFMVTRHPFLRLGIAYKLKFEGSNEFFHSRYGKEIVRMYRHDAGPNPAGDDVTFSEFVQYVGGLTSETEMNEHWESLAHLCQPCQMRYDFILHHETLTQDSIEVLQAAMLSSTIPHFPEDHWDAIPVSYVHDHFKHLTPLTVGHLVSQYKEDFALFSYSSLF